MTNNVVPLSGQPAPVQAPQAEPQEIELTPLQEYTQIVNFLGTTISQLVIPPHVKNADRVRGLFADVKAFFEARLKEESAKGY